MANNSTFEFNVNITLTASKIFAFCLLIAAIGIDIIAEAKGTVFMFTVPFCCGLLTGKQAIDYFKAKKANA